MRQILRCILLVGIAMGKQTATAYAQSIYKVSGSVFSNENGKPVAGASVQILQAKIQVLANTEGKFSFSLTQGSYTIVISAVGFKKTTQEIAVNKNVSLTFKLTDKSTDLSEVVISKSANTRSLDNPQMGVEKLSMSTINNIPALFGERDVVKAIQLLPGIKSSGDGGSGFYVRGGSTDQNLVLMDYVPVYSTSHLLGFFSIFNPDIVKEIAVYKTGMPANYGGRLSSVLDVTTRAPDKERFKASGGIGLISSKLTLETPIKKGKSSFLISGRRTYVDALLRLSPDSTINRNTLFFYDLNSRLDIDLGKKTNLNFTGYMGSDKLGIINSFGVSWGNTFGKVQLKHLFTDKLLSATTAAYTSYHDKIEVNEASNYFQIFSKIDDISLNETFTFQQSASRLIKFGFNSIYHKVTPGEISPSSRESSINNISFQKRYSLENAIFANTDWQISPKLNVSAGLRLSGFSIFGPGDFLTVSPDGTILETEKFAKGQLVKTYLNLEPRLALSYLVNDKSSVKASYVRNTQNMHLVSNATSSNPTDKWLPSSKMIKPELSDQYSIGYYQNLFDNRFELNVESYYKEMKNVVDYKNGGDILNSDAIETQLLYGIGRAYGIELLLKKKVGNFTGWISYTLSKTERKIERINHDNWYNARQDRTHDISIVGMFKISKKWAVSATWVYYTGDAITYPTGRYAADGQVLLSYSGRNAGRMPNYHRLDLGANWTLAQKKNFSSELSFSLYNTYAHKNAYAISYRESVSSANRVEIVRTTLFKLIPSISYNFKFL